MEVPYFDFSQAPPFVQKTWSQALERVASSNRFIGGAIVTEFERKWSDYCGTSDCVGVANGLDALSIALRALGVGANHRVALPAHTFIATWLAVWNLGAIPVGVDVDEHGLISLDELEALPTPPDAVIAVHLHGRGVDMKRLMGWAKDQGVLILEDCAQAHGLNVQGKRPGAWGHAGAYSFYPTKNLGALGDAGAIVSNSEEVIGLARMISNYGSTDRDKYHHPIAGVNSRLDPFQAAVLSTHLDLLDQWNRRRSDLATFYRAEFSHLGDSLRILGHDARPSVWHHFIIQVSDRDHFRHQLNDAGVHTEIHYPSVAAREVHRWSGLTVDADFPVAGSLARSVVSLPLNQWMTDSQAQFVAEAVKASRRSS